MGSMFLPLKSVKAWIGLDGFIDRIMLPVQTRTGMGNAFKPYESLKDFGQRIQMASGSNLNIELFEKIEKMGGNGPLLANAMVNLGVDVRDVGTLGLPVHPLFQDFAKKTKAISLGNYGETCALEFLDGKLILGNTQVLDQITYERLEQFIPKDQWIQTYTESSLISWQNWTMMIHMTEILKSVLSNIWPYVENKTDRICFFDLADPAKRSYESLKCFLELLPKFRDKSSVFLGLNRAEAKYVGELLGLNFPKHMMDESSYGWIRDLQKKLSIDGIFVHCCDGALAVVRNEIAFEPAQPAKCLTCLTGSGDHFNAGCLSGLLMNLSLAQCLRLGHITSVLYIESGQSPTLESVEHFYLNNIKQERM